MNLETLTELVFQRLQYPVRAKLIGKEPAQELGFRYVRSEPYDAVVLGILTSGMLLRMPSDVVCRALLDRRPVYLWPEQPYRNSEFRGPIYRELQRAESRLVSLGAVYLPGPNNWITETQALWMKQAGMQVEQHCKLTPLAREIMGERTWSLER